MADKILIETMIARNEVNSKVRMSGDHIARYVEQDTG
jgi:hypothetical protein